jgi:tight adherence protein C
MAMTATDTPILIAALAFLTMFLLFWGLRQYLHQNSKKRELLDKIKAWSKNLFVVRGENLFLKTESGDKKSFLHFLNFLGKSLVPGQTRDYSRMRVDFLRAGLRKRNITTVFWGTKCFLAMSLPVCFILVRVTLFKLVNPTMALTICLVLAIAGFYFPDAWLHMRIARRRDRIFRGLPDVLDILVVCVEAGMGLDAAIKRVAEEIKLSNKAMSDELKLYNLELSAGKQRQDALRNLAMRTNLEDINSFVTLLIQTEKFGSSIVQALRVYADAFRSKRYLMAEEMAAKVPVKLIVPLILFIFPALFVAIAGPAAIRVFQTFYSS